MLHNFILIFDEFDGIKASYPNYTHINKLYWLIERINPYQCGFIHHGGSMQQNDLFFPLI